MTEEIPGPRAYPVVGNLFDVRSDEGSLVAAEQLAEIYGDVFRLNIAGRRQIVVSSAELLIQFTDEHQFEKLPPPALSAGQGPQGLFTARSDDPDWIQGHRILMPAFGPLPVADMTAGMKDIASQMILKWARLGKDNQILLTDDFTRLTLDTIALCSMDYRFNSFYSELMHPFIDAMNGFLSLSGTISTRPKIYNQLLGSSDIAKRKEHNDTMKRIAKQVIDKRRENPVDRNDLLNTMLYGKDPKTGAAMRDDLIMAEMINFLIAGMAYCSILRQPKKCANHEFRTRNDEWLTIIRVHVLTTESQSLPCSSTRGRPSFGHKFDRRCSSETAQVSKCCPSGNTTPKANGCGPFKAHS